MTIEIDSKVALPVIWLCQACSAPMKYSRWRQGRRTCGGTCAVLFRGSKRIEMLSQHQLRELVLYDPETGIMCRRSGRTMGYVAGNGYLSACVAGKSYLVHRLAWLYMVGEMPDQIDHRNGDRLDNRFSNLRDVALKINNQNERRARKNNKSGLLGAWRRGSRWFSQIKVDGRIHSVGTFDTAEEAHKAYVAAKRILHPGCTL